MRSIPDKVELDILTANITAMTARVGRSRLEILDGEKVMFQLPLDGVMGVINEANEVLWATEIFIPRLRAVLEYETITAKTEQATLIQECKYFEKLWSQCNPIRFIKKSWLGFEKDRLGQEHYYAKERAKQGDSLVDHLKHSRFGVVLALLQPSADSEKHVVSKEKVCFRSSSLRVDRYLLLLRLLLAQSLTPSTASARKHLLNLLKTGSASRLLQALESSVTNPTQAILDIENGTREGQEVISRFEALRDDIDTSLPDVVGMPGGNSDTPIQPTVQ